MDKGLSPLALAEGEETRSRVDLWNPSQFTQATEQFLLGPIHFHDSKLASVVQLSDTDPATGLCLSDVLTGRPPDRGTVDEEEAPAR